MNTESTDKNAGAPAGGIYFDAACRFCVTHRRRWGPVFERRGFVWLPLQTPGAAARLGITEAQLQAEMWLQLADGRNYSGVNAWSALMRRVWWLWPLGLLLAAPGFNAAARALYRWIAQRRHCLGGTCRIGSHGRGA
jgi:predicted DCC family thiol-disulfide oxidoreductase YuxK